MWETILSTVIDHGIWATLFVTLMVYLLRDTAKREKKYQDTIAKLSDSIAKDVCEIKDSLKEKERKK